MKNILRKLAFGTFLLGAVGVVYIEGYYRGKAQGRKDLVREVHTKVMLDEAEDILKGGV